MNNGARVCVFDRERKRDNAIVLGKRSDNIMTGNFGLLDTSKRTRARRAVRLVRDTFE